MSHHLCKYCKLEWQIFLPRTHPKVCLLCACLYITLNWTAGIASELLTLVIFFSHCIKSVSFHQQTEWVRIWLYLTFNLCICRHYPEFPHHLCKPVRAGGVWVAFHLHSLCHHLVLCGPGGCLALWPAVCLQHHSGEYNCSIMCSVLFSSLPSVTADISSTNLMDWFLTHTNFSLWKYGQVLYICCYTACLSVWQVLPKQCILHRISSFVWAKQASDCPSGYIELRICTIRAVNSLSLSCFTLTMSLPLLFRPPWSTCSRLYACCASFACFRSWIATPSTAPWCWLY